MASNELKSLALIAKQRLRNANYTNKNKNTYNNKNSYFIKNVTAMKKLSGNCEFVTITDVEDLQFLKKVYSMLSNSEEIYNPIGRLIDKEYYNSLSDLEKQSYVFKIADKYALAKEKFHAQTAAKNSM